MEEHFIRGSRPPYTDKDHSNKPVQVNKPSGPFSNSVIGKWSDGGFAYMFIKDGIFIRMIRGEHEQPLGYWLFEDTSQTGEIRFFTGECESIKFTNPEKSKLQMDNSQKAISTVYGYSQNIVLEKI
jgi:hypothetical protein